MRKKVFAAGVWVLLATAFASAQVASVAKVANVADADPVLLGAGDIAGCADLAPAEGTAKLLEANPGTVIAIGDLAYSNGSDREFQDCYDKTWGRVKARTKPIPGNHEWHTKDAAGFAHYWQTETPGKYWYSYDLGAWHIVAFDSDCDKVGGCKAGSPEVAWLAADLKAHPAKCTLAYFHHPRYSSGEHGDGGNLKDVWTALSEGGVDVVVNGHDHDYERFAPQDANGKEDDVHGVREFVVGTGGKNLRAFGDIAANSQVRNSDTHGVIRFVLHPDSYEWEFLPIAGKKFTDSGKDRCH